MREQAIMQRVALEATRKGWRVFRNNVGVLLDQRGVPVRYGLMVGSGDLIGWRPVTITPDMVGQQLAQFVSLEVKGPRGRMSPEQARWAAMVEEAGGLALVVRGAEELPT
jgi:hypothetical protein